MAQTKPDSSQVIYDGGTVQGVLDHVKPMADYTALRAYDGTATTIRITTPGITGFFKRTGSAADNGGTVIVDGAERSWERVFDGPVNVQWFGDMTNGSDVFSVVQSCINSGASDIEFPVHGTYVTSARIVLASNITVNLRGSSITAVTSNTPVFFGTGITNVKIRNGTFNGIASDYVNTAYYGDNMSSGIKLNSSTNIDIRECNFNNFGRNGIGLVDCENALVDNNTIVGPGSPIIVLMDNYCFGVWTDGVCSNITITNNDISGTAQGIFIVYRCPNTTIRNNRIHDIPGQHGMYITNNNNLIVYGNVITSTALLGVKIQIDELVDSLDSTNGYVKNNILTNIGSNAIVVDNTAAIAYVANLEISGNIVATAGGNGISLQDCKNSKIFDNLITGTTQGILTRRISGCSITRNKIFDVTNSGIYVDIASNDSYFGFNEITSAGIGTVPGDDYGLFVAYGSGNMFEGNIVKDPGGNSVYSLYVVNGAVTNTRFVRNKFYDKLSRWGTPATFGGIIEWRDNYVFAFTTAFASVASTSALVLPEGLGTVKVTGTTNIDTVIRAGFDFTPVTLVFDSVLTVADSTIALNGAFTSAANSTLTLAFNGAGWREVARSIN